MAKAAAEVAFDHLSSGVSQHPELARKLAAGNRGGGVSQGVSQGDLPGVERSQTLYLMPVTMGAKLRSEAATELARK